jgi:hypothetical protein
LYRSSLRKEDEFGFATILHLMGLDHERLTYFYKGLKERSTTILRRLANRADGESVDEADWLTPK